MAKPFTSKPIDVTVNNPNNVKKRAAGDVDRVG